VEFLKNQTYSGFITQFKNDFFNALNGRIKFINEERQELAEESKLKCQMCKCCVKEVEIGHKIPLSCGTIEKPNF
jgi:hypothetical protein